MNTKLCKEFFYFIEFSKDGILGIEKEKGMEKMFIFYSLKPFPWLLPFLNILQHPLLGLVPFSVFFFPVTIGVLF